MKKLLVSMIRQLIADTRMQTLVTIVVKVVGHAGLSVG